MTVLLERFYDILLVKDLCRILTTLCDVMQMILTNIEEFGSVGAKIGISLFDCAGSFVPEQISSFHSILYFFFLWLLEYDIRKLEKTFSFLEDLNTLRRIGQVQIEETISTTSFKNFRALSASLDSILLKEMRAMGAVGTSSGKGGRSLWERTL